MLPNACTSWGRSARRSGMPSRGGVHDARSAVLHRGALEHSTSHACPASHAPRTSRPRMSRAVIAGTLVGSVAKFVFGAKFKNRVSEIQWLTDCQALEKATLRQNRLRVVFSGV